MPDFKTVIDGLSSELIEFRHELHAHPEIAYEERWTATRIVAELSKLENLRITSDIAETGILAVLNGDRGGPCVALRADMDALPMAEKNDLPYASQHAGRMHACGHDGHMACLVGAARVLHRFADQLPGVVKFIFQPAEEGGAGARRMIEAGVLDSPRVDAAFALHGWPDVPLGTIAVAAGPMLAAEGPFEITLTGKGVHAAYPHQGTDVILAAAHLITMFQDIRGRFIDPMDPALVSVGQIVAGDTHNIMPDTCRIMGTIRALRQETHTRVTELVGRFTRAVPELFGVQAEFKPLIGYPALLNDVTCAELVGDVAEEVLGRGNANRSAAAGMGAEDFAFFAREVPSALYQLGLRPPDRPDFPALHNPAFDFTDAAVPLGTHLHCAIAHRMLTSPPTWKCG